MASKFHDIKRAILNNKELKILSLLLAIISWYAIRGIISNERDIADVALEIHAPSGIAVMGQGVSEVNVTVRGSREDISKIIDQKEDIKAVVELDTADISGSKEISIMPHDIVGLPGQVALDRAMINKSFLNRKMRRLPNNSAAKQKVKTASKTFPAR